ncbi:MAG: hypothetical protein Q9216_001915 [Gyalolechia sp. 2 TL-2023]
MRSPEKTDFRLGKWLFKKGSMVFLNSWVAHRNSDVWNTGDANGEYRGSDEFWAERFLRYDGDEKCGPVGVGGRSVGNERSEGLAGEAVVDKTVEGDGKKTVCFRKGERGAEDLKGGQKGQPKFSLDETTGAFVPFGGGVGMCPGRFFAKNEKLASLAMLVTAYDFQLTMPER